MKIKCPDCTKEYDSSYDVCPHCGSARNEGKEKPAKAGKEGSLTLAPGTILNQRYQAWTVIKISASSILYKGEDLVGEYPSVFIREYYPRQFCSRGDDGNSVIVENAADYDTFKKGLDQFIRDGNTQRGLGLGGVIAIYDVFVQNQTGYLVMERPEGINLRKYLRTKGKMSLNQCMANMLPVMDTLEQLHQMKILHLSINPSNILLLEGGEVKVMDVDRYTRLSTKPSAGDRKGRKARSYRAPEWENREKELTDSADVYSVCTVMSQMLKGDEALPAAIDNGLIADPEYRVPNITTLMQQLTSIHEVERISMPGQATRGRRVRRSQKRKKRLFSLAAGFVIIIMAIALLAFFRNKSTPSAPSSSSLAKSSTKKKFGKGKVGTVPDLVGMDYKEAAESLKEEGLNIKRVDARKAEDDEQENLIVSQSPAAGDKSPASDTIDVVVTSEEITLRDIEGLKDLDSLKGQKLKKETKKSLQKNFSLKIVKKASNYIPGYMIKAEANDEKDKAIVLKMDTKRPRYSKLKLTVSSGQKDIKTGEVIDKVNRDDLIGKAFKYNMNAAQKYGFYIGIAPKKEYSLGGIAQKDEVSSISSNRDKDGDEPSKEIKTGDELVLTLSKGPKGVYKTTDELEKWAGGMPYNTVRDKLQDNHIKVKRTENASASVGPGCVITLRQKCVHEKEDLDEQAQDYEIHWDDTVTVVVSTGPGA